MADADFNVKAIISAQTSQFEKGMKDAQASINSVSKSIEGVQKLLKSAFSVVGIGLSIKAVTDFGRSCVQSATQAQKAFNILDNTVKATGADAWTSVKELENVSKTLSDSTNYSVTEIQKMQSVLLGFTNITGETFNEASEAVLDMATVMGMDLTSAVQTVGKALDDPITGLDSLRRQGFKFTDEQKTELTQLVRNGKQLEAQKIILDTLAISYGGASKAGQDSFAKQRHSVENFSDTLGGKLIPVMQVFAENNSKMLNSLTDVISKMDFTPVVNVITNLSKIFDTAFENISAYLKKGANEVSDFITRFNFKPIVSVLDTLIGVMAGVISKFKEINSQKLEIFEQIKESVISFSNSDLFANITDFINKIIDGVFFLWSEIQDIVIEIKSLIVDNVINIWNKIKELFENSQGALANSGQDIASWGDFFWTVLNNVFKTVQNFINMIKAILHGDWSVAWEYAKLAVLRVCDNILTALSTVMNAFPKLVNKIIDGVNGIIKAINKVREFIGQDPFGLVEAFDSVDFSKSSGLDDKIKETEDKIQELTGHVADIAIENLEGVSTEFAGFTTTALGYIHDLTKGVKEETNKQKEYFSSVPKESENSYKAFSEWDSKLLKQKQNDLSEYSEEYHEINIQLIEQERKKALENAKTEEERAKINEYYNKEIEEENERFEKAKREKARQTFHIIIAYTKKFLQDTIAGFKKVVDTFKKVFSTIGNFVKNTFDKLKNIFSTLFEFNVDDALNNLLKIEDAVLTFFVETLPRLPNFFESAFGSVLTLIQTLVNSIDWNSIKNILDSIIKTFVTYAPQIVSGIVDVFTNLVTTISTVLVDNAPQIVDAFGQMFFTILEALPSIISNFIRVVGTYLSEIGKYITNNFDRLSEDLSNIVKLLVDGIAEFISSGGWKNLLDGLLSIQEALEKAITDNIDNIVDTIISALPDLIDMLIDSIVSASKTLAKLIRPIIKLVLAIISALIDVLTSDEVMDASLDAVMAFIEAIFEELIPGIIKLIPKLILKIIAQVIKNLPKLVKSIITGLIEAFTKTNWIQVVKDIFTGFIDAFKDLFGIHSPSTLFEGFGFNIVEGLVNGLKGIAEAVNMILEPLYNFITDVFGGIGETITNIINVSFKGLKDLLDSLLKTIKDLTEISFKGLNDILGTLGKSLTDLTDVSFKGLNDILGTLGNSLSDITKISFKGLTDSLDSVGKTLTDITNGSFKGLNDIIGTMNSGLKDLTDVSFKGLKDLLDSSADAIVRITDSATKLLDSLKGIAEVLPKIPDINLPGLGGGSNGGGSNGGGSNGGGGTSSGGSGLLPGLDLPGLPGLPGLGGGSGGGGGGIFDLGGLLGGGAGGTPIDLTPGGIGELIAKPITGLLGGGSSKPLSTGSDGWDTAIDVLIPGGRQIGGAVKDAVEQASDWVSDAVDSVKDWVEDWWPFANGTNNAPRGLALVGEQGPEIVKFNGGEQVLNTKNTQKALSGMGGSTNNFNVTFNNLQDTSAFAMMNQLKQYNRQMAINGVL